MLFDKFREQRKRKQAEKLAAERKAKEGALLAMLKGMPIGLPAKIVEEYQGRRYILEVTRDGKRKMSIHELIKRDGKEMWHYDAAFYDANGNVLSSRSGNYPPSFTNR